MCLLFSFCFADCSVCLVLLSVYVLACLCVFPPFCLPFSVSGSASGSSVSVSVTVFLFVFLFSSLFVFASLSVCLTVCVCVGLSVCPSALPSAFLCLRFCFLLFCLRLPAFLFSSPFVFDSLSVCLSVCLPLSPCLLHALHTIPLIRKRTYFLFFGFSFMFVIHN